VNASDVREIAVPIAKHFGVTTEYLLDAALAAVLANAASIETAADDELDSVGELLIECVDNHPLASVLAEFVRLQYSTRAALRGDT
jgi:hypothetical protein